MKRLDDGKRWVIAPTDPAVVARVASACALPLPIAAVLVSRGYAEPAAVEAFLDARLSGLADPLALPGMGAAAERILSALEHHEPVVVFGDYDVDGISSTALLVLVLREMGGQVEPFLPHRVDDGYGLGVEALEKCRTAHKPRLIVTVDCGTGSVEAVEEATKQGVDVVVTDHHEAGGPVAPAVAVVNPKLGSDEGPWILAGVGVAFKLCHALLKMAREKGLDIPDVDLRHYLDLVALGTVADIVPLTGENRALVRRGLERLNRTDSLGLRALVRAAGITDTLEAHHVGYMLGPRLNAAGRLGDAQLALDLLLTNDPGTAESIAGQLDKTNRERQAIERETSDAAVVELDQRFDPEKHFAVVVARKGWHPGVVGIVASRLCERYGRPAIVIACDEEGKGKGSCRSIEGFNIADALGECSDLLLRCGGHAMAAGLEVDVAQLDAFTARFNEVAAASLRGKDLRRTLRVDAWIDLAEADEALLSGMARLRPFGHGNPGPIWGVRGVRVVSSPRILKEKHVKFTVASGSVERECIGFGLGHREIGEGLLDLAFQLNMNHFRGRDTLQLSLKDFRPQGEEG